jgi:hypothetical protein
LSPNHHEYALLGGVNRAKVGRYIGTLAAAISAIVVFLLLAAVNIAHELNIHANLPPSILSLVSAGAVFAALYAFFDRYAWRWHPIARLLNVPNLAGQWNCEGQTLDTDGTVKYRWNGTVTIVQSWDKLRVRLQTEQSKSNSVSAALLNDEIDGYVLLYHYQNEPRIGETDLRAHRGFAELIFAKDCNRAAGEYFNGHGRYTFGTLVLAKVH